MLTVRWLKNFTLLTMTLQLRGKQTHPPEMDIPRRLKLEEELEQEEEVVKEEDKEGEAVLLLVVRGGELEEEGKVLEALLQVEHHLDLPVVGLSIKVHPMFRAAPLEKLEDLQHLGEDHQGRKVQHLDQEEEVLPRKLRALLQKEVQLAVLAALLQVGEDVEVREI